MEPRIGLDSQCPDAGFLEPGIGPDSCSLEYAWIHSAWRKLDFFEAWNRPGFMEPGIGLDLRCLEKAGFLEPGTGLDSWSLR
jgi:hypothetical protein